MIYNKSRYYDGTLAQDGDNILVFRTFPTNQTLRMFGHVWVEGNRIEAVAEKFLGDSEMWHEVMDLNPMFLDPWNIPTGATLRVEYV